MPIFSSFPSGGGGTASKEHLQERIISDNGAHGFRYNPSINSLGYYDEDAGKWIDKVFLVDKEYNAITQGVSTVLNDNTWSQIGSISEADLGSSIWSVGDAKSITLNGTVGATTYSSFEVWVYILGFNHNSAVEGKGIHFGGFKTAQTNGVDISLCDTKYGSNSSDGTKYYNLNHWGSSSSPYNTNYGGWAGCDARYDILGSTNVEPSGYGSTPTTSRVGYDPSDYDIVNSPVANTLMAALPSDLRAVMKPMTKYTDAVGNSSNVLANVKASIDYLPLLAEYEVHGTRYYANQYEQNYQKQYMYYAVGNSKIKYKDSDNATAVIWWLRSANDSVAITFCRVSTAGGAAGANSRYSYGVAPAFCV